MANQNAAFLFTITITTLLFIISSEPSSNASACNENDKNALLTIISSVNYFPISFFPDWNPGTNCCSWHGVVCDEAGRVTALSIYYPDSLPPRLRAITGPFPSAFGDISALQFLSINSAPFTGTFPESFANLSKLEYLIVARTLVSGPIPDFSANKKLKYLALMFNNFSGPIPRSLTRLPNLRRLNLNNNQLTGSIPRQLFHRSKAGTDLYLEVAGNHLTGNVPEFLGNGNLRLLDASRNNLTGVAQFLSAPQMGSLTVYPSSNRLRFKFTNVSLSKNITLLDLSYNLIQGEIPESLNEMTNLWELDLSNNELCGKIPIGLSNFKAESFVNNTCLCGTPLQSCA